jgi:hypothetical protein
MLKDSLIPATYDLRSSQPDGFNYRIGSIFCWPDQSPIVAGERTHHDTDNEELANMVESVEAVVAFSCVESKTLCDANQCTGIQTIFPLLDFATASISIMVLAP